MTRRTLLATTGALLAPAAMASPRTKMLIHLDAGSLGVKADCAAALNFAVKYGYEAITADANWLGALPEGQLGRFLDEMKAKGVVWANAGLPTDFRGSEENFRKGLAALPGIAQTLKKAGVTRVSTWLSPTSDSLTYVANFKQHAVRLRECAAVLGDNGMRLGLEYVGPKTSWTSRRFPFVHTMKEMKELIAETGRTNIGFLLDSWHWYTAGETVADLMTLTNKDIVTVDLNDAPAGVPLDQQKDNTRELPCATGVIPVADFLNAINKLGCDAPVRCEPFNAALRAMPPDQALETTITAMKKAFTLIS